jgi:hypothetical protein
MAQIVEIIRYGTTVTEQRLNIGNEAVTAERVSQLLATSPYNSRRASDAVVVGKITMKLQDGLTAEHGWARYMVENEV